jgi:hypothetical protein
VLVGRRGVQTRYVHRGGPKRVDYWVMQTVGGTFVPNDEVDVVRWLTVSEATALATHDHDRAVVADLARTDVPRMPRVLLVRHGSAGEREDWDGPDDERPLDRRGREQAARLAAVLPLFGPTRLLTAPPVRCRQTLAPLAAALGQPVGEVPELGDLQPGRGDPDRAARPRGALARQRRGAVAAGGQGQRLGAGRAPGCARRRLLPRLRTRPGGAGRLTGPQHRRAALTLRPATPAGTAAARPAAAPRTR